jgi:hypothetical protein
MSISNIYGTPPKCAGWGGGVCGMAPILTPEDAVRRIAAQCTLINERDALIRLEAAAAIARQYEGIPSLLSEQR